MTNTITRTNGKYVFTAPNNLWETNPEAAAVLARLAVMTDGRRDGQTLLAVRHQEAEKEAAKLVNHHGMDGA